MIRSTLFIFGVTSYPNIINKQNVLMAKQVLQGYLEITVFQFFSANFGFVKFLREINWAINVKRSIAFFCRII